MKIERSRLKQDQIFGFISILKDQMPMLFDRQLDLEGYTNKLADKAEHFYMLEKKLIISFAAVYLNQTQGNFGFISFIGVSQDYRNRGLGLKLIDRIVSECYKIGISELKLEVSKTNKKAQDFYNAKGFLVLDAESNDKSLIMAKSILK